MQEHLCFFFHIEVRKMEYFLCNEGSFFIILTICYHCFQGVGKRNIQSERKGKTSQFAACYPENIWKRLYKPQCFSSYNCELYLHDKCNYLAFTLQFLRPLSNVELHICGWISEPEKTLQLRIPLCLLLEKGPPFYANIQAAEILAIY